jgi:membrane-bound lytic murein transglycosylase A
MPLPRSLLWSLVTVLIVGACAPAMRPASVADLRSPWLPPAAPAPTPTPAPTPAASPPRSAFDALPGWRDDALAEALPAWRRTCERLARVPDDRPVGPDGLAGTASEWQAACRAIPPPEADGAAARAYFERSFVPVSVASGGDDRGLFTGYYEPELRGSRTRRGRFRVPLYARPSDLVTSTSAHGSGRRVRGRLRPYWTRAQIAAGALRRTARTLVWVDDAIEAFFLEIQGSGRVTLDDGTVLRINYAASNGHPYVPLGRVLIDRGALALSAVSLQSIRAWLVAHPAEAQAMMNRNPSYVFFHESARGATGAEGVVLTAGRSMAVDPRFIPLGAPLFVDLAPLEGVGSIRRLVVAQDTGGAIRGRVRGDLFWGAGTDARDRAGRMRQQGRYWLLVPPSVAARVRW